MPHMIDLTTTMDPANRALLPVAFERWAVIVSPEIEYLDPRVEGREAIMATYGCSVEDLPDGEGYGSERLSSMSTHCGTHVDAPLHSGATIEGRPARTISDLELHELVRPGIVLDVRDSVNPSEGISVSVLEETIRKTGVGVQEGNAILIRTGQERYAMGDPEFYEYPGMTAEGTRFLTSLGATILGTDALAWDRPFPLMAEEFKNTRDKSVIWDGHFAIREREAFIVQRMANLAALPAHGFTVGVFPIKLYKTSAAPARVVAFLPD